MKQQATIIKKILIANRSEIALRIIFTCKSLGIKTVAIYVIQDATSPYVYYADEAYQLSQPEGYGYLHQADIISIAKQAGVDAIHPGYGFLSENGVFAQAVIDAGFIWIGPQPDQIILMGDKQNARTMMLEHNVPVAPGYMVNLQDKEHVHIARKKADSIGYPIIIKSARGGGGKAMRKVETAKDFDTAWHLTGREAQKFFHDTTLIIEKYIEKGRHIEVQIAADDQDVIHLFERDCSVQRRHQKIIEETPCTFISEKTRQNLYDYATKAARAVGYTSIGTVEFIVTPDEECYFLEMNTRLQVEHPVTEFTVGCDLVALQIKLAQKEKLSWAQQDISQRGHALECRIYAEDTYNNFAPSSGVIRTLHIPHHPFTRFDHTLEQGCTIYPFFDPMIAKVITGGRSRAEAVRFMITTLQDTHIDGVKTNIPLLLAILTSPDFQEGNFHTQWLTARLADLHPKQASPEVSPSIACIAATLAYSTESVKTPSTVTSPWKTQQWL